MLTIDEIKRVVTRVGKKYGIKSAYLFGSYARGEAKEDSDVDLIIDKGDIKGLQLSAFRLELIDGLNGVDVDVLTEKSLRPKFSELIKKDRMLIYGA